MEVIGIIIGALALTVTIIGIWLGQRSQRQKNLHEEEHRREEAERRRDEEEQEARKRENLTTFTHARQVLKQDSASLVEQGLEFYAKHRLPELRLLGREGWVFDSPRPLDAIRLSLEEVQRPEEFQPAVDRLAELWPDARTGAEIRRYSDAIHDYDKPRLWSRGTETFRLVEVRTGDNTLDLSYEISLYHDATDTQEALSYVAAAGLPLADYLPTDPFDLRARGSSTAICTLTLIDSNPPRFIYHFRSGAVHQAAYQIHIVPAGEFEPAVVGPDIHEDFSLWTNIQREYAEEFLGLPDGLAVDLDDRPDPDHPTLALLTDLRDSGDLTLWTYGLGMNPITLKPEMLAVGVVSPEGEERVFPKIQADHEGAKRMREFTWEEVEKVLVSGRTNPVAHALLHLAWRDRDQLLTHPPKES